VASKLAQFHVLSVSRRKEHRSMSQHISMDVILLLEDASFVQTILSMQVLEVSGMDMARERTDASLLRSRDDNNLA
jgi:hypothetical protein